jgi:hypothetical protein
LTPPKCPLTRYKPQRFEKRDFDLFYLTNVKSWRLVLQIPCHYDDHQCCVLKTLSLTCEALSKSSMKFLDIAIIPNNVAVEDLTQLPRSCSLDKYLKPLDYIRNMERVTVRDADIFEVPDAIHQNENLIQYESQLWDFPEIQVSLVTRLEGNQPVEILSKQYAQTLKYAQCFEEYGPFRLEMALASGEHLQNEYRYGYYMDSNNEIDFVMEDWSEMLGRNPFRGTIFHPVGMNLALADLTQQDYDAALFKDYRKKVIKALEPQYQRIAKAAGKIAKCVKQDKLHDGFLSIHHSTAISNYKVPIELLKDYAASFHREIPAELISQFEHHKRRLKALYSMLDSSIMVAKVMRSYDLQQRSSHIVDLYQKAVDKLDQRFLAIRKARKELFVFDVLDITGVTLEE